MSDVFVSYARPDLARVQPLVELLKHTGWSVWWDPNIVGGDEFEPLIKQEIDGARCVVVVWSSASAQSPWVRSEAGRGRAQHKLVPVKIDACDLPLTFGELHTIDLLNWNGAAHDAKTAPLLAAVAKRLGIDTPPSATISTPASPPARLPSKSALARLPLAVALQQVVAILALLVGGAVTSASWIAGPTLFLSALYTTALAHAAQRRNALRFGVVGVVGAALITPITPVFTRSIYIGSSRPDGGLSSATWLAWGACLLLLLSWAFVHFRLARALKRDRAP